jgi:hypothetical protein
MKIVLHIERLVLDGLAVAPTDRPRIAAAMEAEFTRLLRDAPVPATSGATPRLAAPSVMLAPGMAPEPMGRAIAASAHAGLRGGS